VEKSLLPFTDADDGEQAQNESSVSLKLTP